MEKVMNKTKVTKSKVRNTKIAEKKKVSMAEELNQVPVQTENNNSFENENKAQINKPAETKSVEQINSLEQNHSSEVQGTDNEKSSSSTNEQKTLDESIYEEIFDIRDAKEFVPQDFVVEAAADSLEAQIGYSSLFRLLHNAFLERVRFYISPGGGSLSVEEARKQAFHACTNDEEAKRLFNRLMRLPLDHLDFVNLKELHHFAPRVAERFWELAKKEGGKEFTSGHLGANITFPVGYMKQLWNIARYLGVRESFIAEWKPKGGIEISLIDMLTQSFFQWQYWLEQTVKRSETPEREEHPEYREWQRLRGQIGKKSWADGHWLRPYVSEVRAIEHAVQMADRWNRIYMRTLRQLRDLRRYSPVTINNPNQVNIAAEGGQQVNVANTKPKEEEKMKKISS